MIRTLPVMEIFATVISAEVAAIRVILKVPCSAKIEKFKL